MDKRGRRHLNRRRPPARGGVYLRQKGPPEVGVGLGQKGPPKKLASFQWGWGASYEAAPPRGTSQPPSSGLEVPMRLMAFNHRELARAAGRGTRRWRRKLAHPNCQHRAHEIDTVGCLCCRSSTLLLCARSHTTGPRCCVELAPVTIAACSGDAKATVWRCHAARVMQMAGRSDRWEMVGWQRRACWPLQFVQSSLGFGLSPHEFLADISFLRSVIVFDVDTTAIHDAGHYSLVPRTKQ